MSSIPNFLVDATEKLRSNFMPGARITIIVRYAGHDAHLQTDEDSAGLREASAILADEAIGREPEPPHMDMNPVPPQSAPRTVYRSKATSVRCSNCRLSFYVPGGDMIETSLCERCRPRSS